MTAASLFTQKVRRAFSAAAPAYDSLAGVQQDIGRALLGSLPPLTRGRLLDVGCGTGSAIIEARRQFPTAQAIGLDLSEGMLATARQKDAGVQWVQADAQALPFAGGSMDIVISNLVYQWVDDYDRAFAEVFRVLGPSGMFHATLFGDGTCRELLESFCAVSPAADFRTLPAAAAVRRALERQGFGRAAVTQTHVERSFAQVKDLLLWLKGTGANNLGRGDFFLGKGLLAQVEAHYRRCYPADKGIRAGFDVIWISGRKA